jgi:HlyD family secretion protein
MNKKFLLIIPIIMIAVFTLKMRGTQVTQPDDGYLFSGTAEVTQVRLAFKTSGRIKDLYFDEGDTIQAGQTVAELDSTDEKIAVAAAYANLDYSNAQLSEVLAGSRKQEIKNAGAALDMAAANVKKAEAELQLTKSDHERFSAMYKEDTASMRSYEQYKTAYEKALSAKQEADAAYVRAKETLSMVVEGARSEAIDKAKAQVAISEHMIIQAKQRLEYTSLATPISGTVLTRSAEPGEFVQAGAVILTAGDLNDMWIRGYVSQPYLGKIALGQKVIITSDSYPDKKYDGVLTYISDEAEFTPKSVQTYDERVNFMYRIKISVENRNNELKHGMPVEGKIVY